MSKTPKNSSLTPSGLRLTVKTETIKLDTAMEQVHRLLDTHKGAIFSSGLEYPGRHSRWDIGFTNPALEFVSRGRTFSIQALNSQGEFILPFLEKILKAEPAAEQLEFSPDCLKGKIANSNHHFSEEERTRQASVFSVLRAIRNSLKTDLDLADKFGFYGAFGYDLVLQFEDLKLNHQRKPSNKDCHLFLPLEVFIVDRQGKAASRTEFSLTAPSGESSSNMDNGGQKFPATQSLGSTDIISDHAPGEFTEKVQKVIDGTKRGDYFEVVISQSFETRCDLSPVKLFQKLSKINPSPYLFCINLGDEQLVGSSPEIYVRVKGNRYETCPIAGTVKRGDSAIEDADQVRALISSLKDESELTMCTDVDRNDMARVCKPGTVKVIGRRQLEFYSHLIHTVDHVCGELAEEFDSLDAFQTHMWACTVTGAPKPAALQEIENLEKSPRGWYSGAVGLLMFNGDINTGITLRTAHLKNGRATTRSGATLLFGSDPVAEEQETLTKAGSFLAAVSNKEETEKNTNFSNILKTTKLEKKILLIDCRDSFVHNLASYMRELGCEVQTLRPGFPPNVLKNYNPDLIFFSPGPGTPEDFRIPEMVKEYSSQGIPLFGVCLGHQGIAQAFGAKIAELPGPQHGKISKVEYFDPELYQGISQSFEVGRYHSLYVVEESLPDSLIVTARTICSPQQKNNSSTLTEEPSIIMGFRHRDLPIASVQFHPESLMTLKQGAGHQILLNAIKTLCS